MDVGSSAPVNSDVDDTDVDDDDDNNDDRNNNNHEKQEESDVTQQYPKRTREQVVNDKYILKQQITRQRRNITVSDIKMNIRFGL